MHVSAGAPCPPCPFPAFRAAWPLVGSYRVVAVLGSGGYGLVYRAEGPDGTEYALKLLKPRVDPSAARRLLREARAVALLRHPRLVHCHDVGIELGHPYLVLEYLPGGEVTVLRRRYPQGIPREVLLTVALDAAEGLAALHAVGMCHRDVKPANLLFDAEGRIRLADFGLVASDSDEQLSGGTVVGTPDYMAPELFRGAGPSPQADLYSLGATLYHLACGHPPHDAEDLKELARQVVNEPFPDPCVRAPWLDRDVGDLIRRLGAKDGGERYTSARALIEDLERLLRHSQPLHGLQAARADIAPAWSAYVYHDGEADEDLFHELRRHLHQEMRPVEISALGTALQAGQPLLVVYDAWRWSEAVAAWTRWLAQQAPQATLVVLARQASEVQAQALRHDGLATVIVPHDDRPAHIVERIVSAISTATEHRLAQPGVPPPPALVDIALTRVIVLGNRVDCGDRHDAERYARSCAALAAQLHGERQFYARALALAMMRCLQDARVDDRERLRRLLARAAHLLECTHRGSDLRWEHLDVLIVDDDAATTLSLTAMLQRHGARCRVAHDAEAALAEAARRLPQAVVSDIAMPERNGFEFVERLRALPEGRCCPVLFVTGFAGLADFLGQAPRAGCDVVGKPVRGGELWLRLLVLLGEARLPRCALAAQALQPA